MNLAFSVEKSSNTGVGVVAGQNEAGFRLGAGSLANSRVHGQLVVVRIRWHIVFKRSSAPLYTTSEEVSKEVNLCPCCSPYSLNCHTEVL